GIVRIFLIGGGSNLDSSLLNLVDNEVSHAVEVDHNVLLPVGAVLAIGLNHLVHEVVSGHHSGGGAIAHLVHNAGAHILEHIIEGIVGGILEAQTGQYGPTVFGGIDEIAIINDGSVG